MGGQKALDCKQPVIGLLRLLFPYLFAFYTRCHGAPGPDKFYHFSKELAGYPFVFGERSCSTRWLPREL
jgi:hypothetical protein